MSNRVRVTISIVISAVLLGMVVSFLIRTWMPVEAFDWVMYGVMVLVGLYAIYRIATLAKALGAKEQENE
ncbi:MAG: hypothetical protein IJX40_06455 [Alistipes sp.]|nr:hypothetical protein [Alistipes sp.]